LSGKQLKQLCKDKNIPLRSKITTVGKLEECCGPTVTLQEAAARDCIAGKQLKKMNMQAPLIAAKPINLPPAQPQFLPPAQPQFLPPAQPQFLPPAQPQPAQPKLHKISPQEKQILAGMCPHRDFYANQIPNRMTRMKFLEMCDQVARGLA
jgi:hypothetical protein